MLLLPVPPPVQELHLKNRDRIVRRRMLTQMPVKISRQVSICWLPAHVSCYSAPIVWSILARAEKSLHRVSTSSHGKFAEPFQVISGRI